jgi:WD40 repeat protein
MNTLTGHNHWVSCISKLENKNVISASFDKTFKIWDVVYGDKVAKISICFYSFIKNKSSKFLSIIILLISFYYFKNGQKTRK